MVAVIIFVVSIIAAAVGCGYELVKGNRPPAILCGVAALATLLFLTFAVVPQQLGWGRVPFVFEEYTERLDTGVTYLLIASVQNGEGQVLLVQKELASDFYAIRVNGTIPPPKRFVLVSINGETIVMAPPVGVK
jgi:hypothetical protein